jgi:hypothetical protein
MIEAEYRACGAAARERLPLFKALGELASLSGDFPVLGDLCLLVTIRRQHCHYARTARNIANIHHFARDHKLQFMYLQV